MHDQERPDEPGSSLRSTPPTLKERNAVQRSVDRLLDELAPEQALRRGERPTLEVELHRTPSGCVLQAPTVALTVSWFADATEDATLGELQILTWRGTVTRRGAPRPPVGAVVTGELVLHPFDAAGEESGWKASDGRVFDSAGLAAHCVTILDELRD